MGRTIAILFHENDHNPDRYVITRFADYWREEGFDVRYLFGARRFVPADLVIVHVNLSLVPPQYLELAARYPRALNGGVADIRKSAFSRNLVSRGDAYRGPVIVKSDLNYAGVPERLLLRRQDPASRILRSARARARRLLGLGAGKRASPLDYEVYDSIDRVPDRYFGDARFVVERFLPEMENGLYHVRTYQFLGDRSNTVRLASRQPIVNGSTSVGAERVDPPEELVRLRERWGFDYGKFDYVVREGEVVLFDANKTPGRNHHMEAAAIEPLRRERAAGIHHYFQEGRERS